MAGTPTNDHALFSTEEYRRKDRDLLRAEEVTAAAEAEIRVWKEHRIPDASHGRLFDPDLPARP